VVVVVVVVACRVRALGGRSGRIRNRVGEHLALRAERLTRRVGFVGARALPVANSEQVGASRAGFEAAIMVDDFSRSTAVPLVVGK
jgi:hypothetical protein